MTVLATDIEIGTHITRTFGGVTFNVDTMWSTVLAGTLPSLLLADTAVTDSRDVVGRTQR